MEIQQNVAAVTAELPNVRVWQEELYRDLHAHPELSRQEHRTAAIVADLLRHNGFDVQERIDGTGVVGVLRNGDGPGVMLRADMDALPMLETTGLPYASKVSVNARPRTPRVSPSSSGSSKHR